MLPPNKDEYLLKLKNIVAPFLYLGDSNYVDFLKSKSKREEKYIDRLNTAFHLSPHCVIIINLITTILSMWECYFFYVEKWKKLCIPCNMCTTIDECIGLEGQAKELMKIKHLFLQRKIVLHSVFNKDRKVFCAFVYVFNKIVHKKKHRENNIFVLISNIVKSDYSDIGMFPYEEIGREMVKLYQLPCDELSTSLDDIENGIKDGLYSDCFILDSDARVKYVKRLIDLQLLLIEKVLNFTKETDVLILKYLPDRIKKLIDPTLYIFSTGENLTLDLLTNYYTFIENMAQQKIETNSANSADFYSFIFGLYIDFSEDFQTYKPIETMILEHPLEKCDLNEFCVLRLKPIHALLRIMPNENPTNKLTKIQNYKDIIKFLDSTILNVILNHKNTLNKLPAYIVVEMNNETFFIHKKGIKIEKRRNKSVNLISISIYCRQKIGAHFFSNVSKDILSKLTITIQLEETKPENLLTFLKNLQNLEYTFKTFEEPNMILIYEKTTEEVVNIKAIKTDPLVSNPDLTHAKVDPFLNEFHARVDRPGSSTSEHMAARKKRDFEQFFKSPRSRHGTLFIDQYKYEIMEHLKKEDQWNLTPLATSTKIIHFIKSLCKQIYFNQYFPKADILLPVIGFYLKKEADERFKLLTKTSKQYMFEVMLEEVGRKLMDCGAFEKLKREVTIKINDIEFYIGNFLCLLLKSKLLKDHGFSEDTQPPKVIVIHRRKKRT